MTYKLVENGVTRLSDNASIPAFSGNRDWREYQEWLTEGNTPFPADPPPPPTQDQIDAAAAKQYQKLKNLTQMTPAQVQAWVQTNVTTLAQAQDVITTLAVAISVLARRL